MPICFFFHMKHERNFVVKPYKASSERSCRWDNHGYPWPSKRKMAKLPVFLHIMQLTSCNKGQCMVPKVTSFYICHSELAIYQKDTFSGISGICTFKLLYSYSKRQCKAMISGISILKDGRKGVSMDVCLWQRTQQALHTGMAKMKYKWPHWQWFCNLF